MTLRFDEVILTKA